MASQLSPVPTLGGNPGGRRLVVVGGGLAGLATAVAAARSGWTVTLLEKRPYLGGRAFSFVDRDTGVEVDNGQHVFLGACTEYIAFLKEIGAWENVTVQDRLDIPVLLEGRVRRLRWSNRIPTSMGLLPSLLRYGHLGLRDKLRVIYGMMRIRGVPSNSHGFYREAASPPAETGALDSETFERWLRRHGQNDATVRNLWNLIVLPALNDDISQVSAEAGVMLFQTALLGGREAAVIGYSRVALSRLAGDAAAAYLARNGGTVRLSTEVAEVEVDGAGAGRTATGVTTAAGERIECDAVVVAVPHFALGEVLPEDLRNEPPFDSAGGLGTAPIVGVHVWYDRPVIDDTFVAVLGSPVQWVFNVDAMHTTRPEAGEGGVPGQHVVISLSGAWRWSQMTRDELRETFVPEMARLFSRAAGAVVTRFLSVKQVQATFRCTPGSAGLRVGQRTPVRGLFLAGDWTATGWPSTMESAVRSGNLAAAALAGEVTVAGAAPSESSPRGACS